MSNFGNDSVCNMLKSNSEPAFKELNKKLISSTNLSNQIANNNNDNTNTNKNTLKTDNYNHVRVDKNADMFLRAASIDHESVKQNHTEYSNTISKINSHSQNTNMNMDKIKVSNHNSHHAHTHIKHHHRHHHHHHNNRNNRNNSNMRNNLNSTNYKAIDNTSNLLNPELIPKVIRKSLIDLHKKSVWNLSHRPHTTVTSTNLTIASSSTVSNNNQHPSQQQVTTSSPPQQPSSASSQSNYLNATVYTQQRHRNEIKMKVMENYV